MTVVQFNLLPDTRILVQCKKRRLFNYSSPPLHSAYKHGSLQNRTYIVSTAAQHSGKSCKYQTDLIYALHCVW